jgi:hypothetical protein
MRNIIEEIQRANTPDALLEQIKQIGHLKILNLKQSEKREIYGVILNHRKLDTTSLDLLVNIANSMGDMSQLDRLFYNDVLHTYEKLIPGTKKDGLTHLVEAIKKLPQKMIEQRTEISKLAVEVSQYNELLPLLIKFLYQVKEAENKNTGSQTLLLAKGCILNALAQHPDTPTSILDDVRKEAEKMSTGAVILRNLDARKKLPKEVESFSNYIKEGLKLTGIFK